MPIPPEILAVPRLESTRVKKSGDRWPVIKRTCRREGKPNIPGGLGTTGEILDGKYVEIHILSRGLRGRGIAFFLEGKNLLFVGF